MKKFFVLLAFCGSVFAANAQSEVGSITLQPKVGINLASMTDYDDSKMIINIDIQTNDMTKTSNGDDLELKYEAYKAELTKNGFSCN